MHRTTPKLTYLTLGLNVKLTISFAFKCGNMALKGHLVQLQQHRKYQVQSHIFHLYGHFAHAPKGP